MKRTFIIIFALYMQQTTPMQQAANYISRNFTWLNDPASHHKPILTFDNGLQKNVYLNFYSTEEGGFGKDGILEKKIPGTSGLEGLLERKTPDENEYLICTTMSHKTPRCFGHLGRGAGTDDTSLFNTLLQQYEDAYEAKVKEQALQRREVEFYS